MIFGIRLLSFAVAATLLASATGAAEIYAYPPEGRTHDQQQQDQFECHKWVVEQSKFDPVQESAQSLTSQPNVSQQQPATQSRDGSGVLSGAAKGALIGEVTDDKAGEGAVAGAALGLVRGRMAEKQAAAERAAAEARAQQQAKQKQAAETRDLQAKQQAYQRARATCFRARGYTVSEG